MKQYFVRFIYDRAVVCTTVESDTNNAEAIIADAMHSIEDELAFFVGSANDVDIEEV